MPEMIAVQSSSVDLVGYDGETGDLYVQFGSGRTYVYAAVPSHVFDELLRAPSKGAYVNREIKPNYACRLV